MRAAGTQRASGNDEPIDGVIPLPVGRLAVLTQLSQRKLCQWMVAYLAFAFLVLQLLGVLSDIWLWSIALQRVVSLALGLGALPAGVIAWYHGERGRQEVTRVEVAILTALFVGAAFVIWSFIAPSQT